MDLFLKPFKNQNKIIEEFPVSRKLVDKLKKKKSKKK
jgi:hypothetical protein